MWSKITFLVISAFILSMVTPLPAQGNKDPEYTGDTIALDEITISVLPFGQAYQEATGGLFTVRTGTVGMAFSPTTTELFNLAPGVHMASGTYSTNRLVIRGVGSRTPYNTNRIRAYLDDIPLTSGDGISTLEDLDITGIGHVEILKGPSSALYGAGLGGIVRLNSSYPAKDGFTASLRGEIGSFDTGRFGVSTSYKQNRLAITAGIARTVSEGYRENSDYSRNNIFLNAKYFGARNKLSVTLSIVDLFARIPSSLNETDFINEPWKSSENWLEIKGYEEYTRFLGGINIESQLSNKLTNHLVLFTTFADPYESRPFNILDDRSTSLGFREYLQYEMGTFNLRAGAEFFYEWYDWQIYETQNGMQGNQLADYTEKRKYANTFAMVQWRPSTKVLIDAGFNLNILNYSLQTNYVDDSTDQTGSYSYPVVLSPRLGISFNHHSQHHLYASAGHGFSAPSLEETLLPEGNINTELKPETGWNLEVGNRGLFLGGRIRYDATIYAIFLNNLLVTERIAEDIFTGANAGKALNTGLELWAQASLIEDQNDSPLAADVSIGYTLNNNQFTDFVDDGIDYSGNTLPGIPSQKLNTILSGGYGPLILKLNYQYTGDQWMNDTNDQKYNAFQLFHIQLLWKQHFLSIPFTVEVHAGIRNLFNAHYASMILVNAPSFGGNPPRYYYPGLPRQYHMGIVIHFR